MVSPAAVLRPALSWARAFPLDWKIVSKLQLDSGYLCLYFIGYVDVLEEGAVKCNLLLD